MMKTVCYAIGLVFAATHAFAGVVPAPKPFYAGEEQTDARLIYIGGSGSGGKLAFDNHAEFMLARDDSNVALNWCNAGTFKWSFGFFSFDGPRSEYPQFQADVNGSPAVTFDGKDKFRMILEPGFGYTLPDAITDGKLSIELWVVNPSVAKDEVLIRFEDKPGYDLTCKQFKMKGSKNWQHLVAISDGSKTTFYRDGSLVGTEQKALKFSGEAVINLGAKSLSGSLAALRIHTEPMNAADVSHNYKGGAGLGTYLFYAINANYQSSSVDVHGDPNITTGDPTACSELMWRESAHFRSMWVDDPEDPEMATRVKTKQLPDAEKFYAFFNEKTGKHLPLVSNHERKRGDGRKYKWLVGNGSGNYSGWSDALGLGYGVSYRGYASFHEYTHGTDNHQMGAMTDQWWEIHANFTPSWGGADNGVNPAEAKPKGAHAYPAYGGNYYHDYLIFDHFVDTPEFGGLFVTRLWNRPPRNEDVERDYPPQTMEDCDPSPETPFNEEWVKCAAKNITWDYPRNPDYARYWAGAKYKGHLHFTLLEPVPYLSAGWYEPPKWRTPQQHGYNISALEPNEGTVTADLTGFVEASRGSAWSAMFVAVDNGNPRYGNIFTNGTQGSFNVQSGDDELYLVVVATPTKIMEIGIFGHEHQDNTDYRGAQKDRFPYQVLLGGTTPKPDAWRPSAGIDPSATVDGTAYVSPNAYVGPNANILGNARVEDYARVNGTVRDNAIVSDYAVVEAKAIIRDNARVTDFAIIKNRTIVENSAHVMEHAFISSGQQISDNAIIKGNAINMGPIHGSAIIDGNYIKNGEHDKGYWFLWSWGDYLVQGEVDQEFNQLYLEYQFEVDNAYRVWDTYGITWGRLLNGPTYVSDNGGTALDLDGQDDFVDLHQSVGQFEQASFDVDVKWDGGANGQKLISFSNSSTGDEAWLSPSDSQGKLAFSIKVGGSTQVVRAESPLPSGSWKNVKLITYNDKVIIHVDDTEWASSSSITHDIDEISANECYIGRGASGDNFGGRIDDFTVWTKALVEDLPPDPNPSQWLVEPMVLDENNVMMQAVLAVDGNPPIEYYFEETSGNPGGSDSGWITSSLYYDLGLNPSTQYTYRVRARDGQSNTTVYSTSKNVTTPATNPGHFIQDGGGTASMEAENYDHLVTGTVTGQSWSFYNGVSGYTGSGTMRVPDQGEAMDVQYAPDRGPRMDFNVKFNRTGTHYMHVRGHGANPNGDSCHGGLDMQEVDTLKTIASFPTGSNEYGWCGDYEFDVPHVGVHKVNIWMREDDTMVDKIVITDTQSAPSGNGPAESSRGGGPAGTQ